MNGVLAGRSDWRVYCDTIRLSTDRSTQFIDLTDWIVGSLDRSGVGDGIVQIQALHTTAAIVINENEPLLLGDFERMLERLVPANGSYGHDDPERRRANLLPAERPNGCAHARALLLGGAKLVNILGGRPELGRWQSILLVELDGPRERRISMTVMGRRREPA